MGEGLVFAYIKDGYWNSLEAMCEEYYRKTSDPFYVFWKAYGEYQNGNATAAINSLLSIQQKKEISYACYVALMHYQNQARNIDKVVLLIFRINLAPSVTKKGNKEETELIKLLFRPSIFWV